MKTFADASGNVWTVAINAASIKRVKGLLGINLSKLIEDGFRPLADLLNDTIAFVDVLYVLCKDEADARNVDDLQFGRGLGGDALAGALAAFKEEYIDFFPDPRVRAGIRKIFAKSEEVATHLIRQMTETMEAMDAESLAKKLIASSGTAPGSSASTRGRSRSAS